MKKKISLKDWTYIGRYNPAAKWLRPLCEYTLTKDGSHFMRQCRIGLLTYIIIAIPVHILQAFYCMWDGGLREFSWQGRDIGYDIITQTNPAWEKANEIWEGK